MNGQQIIDKFETYVDDGTELSASDELDLLNKVYFDVFTDRPWEFAKKAYSVAISGTSKALPTDFAYICSVNENQEKIVKVGDTEYRVINFSERNEYTGSGSYCYVDIVNSLLVFTTSVSGTLTFDYVFFPALLTTSTSPVFPSVYHPVLYHLMAADDYMIQQFDKAKSYAPENQQKANYWLEKMQLWNAKLLT